MRRIDRILLAIQPTQPRRVDLRASLLGTQLDIDSFDVLAVKRTSTGVRCATTYSHVRVDGGTLIAVREGCPVEFPDEPDKLWSVQRGSPADVIAGTAERIGADLTLVAGSGRSRFADWMRPSGNARLVRLSRGAVLLVHAEPRVPYRSVVVATDFSRASLRAARTAYLLAPTARFVFVHACQLPDELLMRECDLPLRAIRSYRGSRAEAARKQLDAFIDRFLHALPPGAREVQIGSPSHVIRACAGRHGADLVVVGRGATHPGAWISSSNVMQKLMDGGPFDLLVGPDAGGDDTGLRMAA
ncbi:MAG: universal stress protein [Telluria sp.]